MNEQSDRLKQTPEACGPGCCCGDSGAGSRTKWVVCGIVALAAAAVVVARVARVSAADAPTAQGFAAQAPTAASTVQPALTPVSTDGVAKTVAAVEAKGLGGPLTSLKDLNKAAANANAVFIVLPSGDTNRMAAVQKEVLAAASTVSAKGTAMESFLLSKESQEYAVYVEQIGSPAVLVMCKGLGMVAVPDKQITQANLIKAFVGASRPSGCGPSGCGPSGCAPAAEGAAPAGK